MGKAPEENIQGSKLVSAEPSPNGRRFVNPAQLYTPSRTNLHHKNGHGAVGENSVDPSCRKVAGFTPISQIIIYSTFVGVKK